MPKQKNNKKQKITKASATKKSSGNDFFSQTVASLDNEYASLASDGLETGDVSGWVDTGSYALNALFSGSIFGGLAANKISVYAGDPSTGKTFFTLNAAKAFLDENPKGVVFDFESEGAINSVMLQSRNIDLERFAVIPVSTVQEFRTQAVKVLDRYLTVPEKDRLPMMFILDSIGQLSTLKEVTDVAKGSDKRDMTRSQLIRGAMRVLNLKLSKAKVPLLVTNHTYAIIGAYGNQKDMGGGEGLKYSASATAFLSKSKHKEGSGENAEVVGAIIRVKIVKSRLTVENRVVKVLLRYDTGLDKYFGLLPLADKFGVVKKVSTNYTFPDGTEAKESAIIKNPEKYFTMDVLKAIDAKCPDEFLYGTTASTVEEEKENE